MGCGQQWLLNIGSFKNARIVLNFRGDTVKSLKFCPQIKDVCKGESCINFKWDETEVTSRKDKDNESIRKPYCELYNKLI